MPPSPVLVTASPSEQRDPVAGGSARRGLLVLSTRNMLREVPCSCGRRSGSEKFHEPTCHYALAQAHYRRLTPIGRLLMKVPCSCTMPGRHHTETCDRMVALELASHILYRNLEP